MTDEPIGYVVGLVRADESQFELPWTTALYERRRSAQGDRDEAVKHAGESAELGKVRVYALTDVTE